MSCLHIMQPPLVFLLQALVWRTTRFIFWHDDRWQLASQHWHACTSDWMHRRMDCLRVSCGFVCSKSFDKPSSKSKSNPSILCSWPFVRFFYVRKKKKETHRLFKRVFFVRIFCRFTFSLLFFIVPLKLFNTNFCFNSKHTKKYYTKTLSNDSLSCLFNYFFRSLMRSRQIQTFWFSFVNITFVCISPSGFTHSQRYTKKTWQARGNETIRYTVFVYLPSTMHAQTQHTAHTHTHTHIHMIIIPHAYTWLTRTCEKARSTRRWLFLNIFLFRICFQLLMIFSHVMKSEFKVPKICSEKSISGWEKGRL